VTWHHPRLGVEADTPGPRWYLDGEPLHCGDALHLRLAGGAELEVTWQVEPTRGGPPAPVLHLTTGRVDEAGTGPALALRPVAATWPAFALRWPEVESGPEEPLPW